MKLQDILDEFCVKEITNETFQPILVRKSDKAFIQVGKLLDLQWVTGAYREEFSQEEYEFLIEYPKLEVKLDGTFVD